MRSGAAHRPSTDFSIAWSVAEFLHDKIKARTLFATHYHELTKLAEERKGVCNFNVAVREWNEQIIFLRKIVPGGADKSYGIQVARLAGLPKEILDRAKDILVASGKAGWRRQTFTNEEAKIDQGSR